MAINDKKGLKKQKVLLPTLKERQRYVVYRIMPGQDPQNPRYDMRNDFENIHEQIFRQCLSMLGIFDGAKAGLMRVKYNKEKGILRINNDYVDKLKVCLSLIKEVDVKIPMIVGCIYVSGMLNKADDKLLDR